MAKSFPNGMFDEKIQEVMSLLEDQGEETPEMDELQSELGTKSKEEMLNELVEDTNEVLTGNLAAYQEYSIMMKQWEALMEDYEQREAEEEAARQAEKGSVD